MSVDTYLRGKDTSGYRTKRLRTDDGELTVLIAPSVAGWSRVELYARRGLTGRKVRAFLERDC